MNAVLAQRTEEDPGMDPLPEECKIGEKSENVSLLCETLSEEYRLKARRELNETEEKSKKGVQRLRNFLTTRNPSFKPDDDFLMLFLRCQKFDLKKSEKRLDKYCSARRELLHLIASIDLQKFRAISDDQVATLLPYRDRHGRAILSVRCYTWNRDLYEIEDLVKYIFVLLHFAATFPATSVNGFCYIGDGTCRSVSELYTIFRAYAKYASYMTAMPFRLQRLDFFNIIPLCRSLYITFRPLLPTKITKRVHLHGTNLEEMHEFFHPSILPNECGGTMGPVNDDAYRDRFMDYAERFRAQCSQFVDTNPKSPPGVP